MVDDFGNRLTVTESPEGGAPCRHCLRRSTDGERLILFAHRPFDTEGPYAEVGPVFVHAGECAPYAPTSTFPPAFADRPLTLRAYDDRGRITDAEVAAPGASEATLARMFEDERVRFVHVRNPAWGCYSFAVERSP
jgi:hypothetical protein